MQFFVSNYMGPELTDVLSSLTCIVVMVFVLKVWKPREILRHESAGHRCRRRRHAAAS
jgi:lactate permease